MQSHKHMIAMKFQTMARQKIAIETRKRNSTTKNLHTVNGRPMGLVNHTILRAMHGLMIAIKIQAN